MAIEALLVYNIALDNSKYQAQLDAFIVAFKKVGVRLLAVPNTKVFKFVEENPSRFAFALFWDRDLHIARYLDDDAHIPVFNNQESINTCNDKALTFLALRNYSVPTPKTIILPFTFNVNVLNFFEEVKSMVSELRYPFLVKERYDSYDEKTFMVKDEKQFKEVLLAIGKKSLLVQQYIAAQNRHIVRINIVGGAVVSTVEKVTEIDSEGNSRDVFKKTHVSRDVIEVAKGAFKAVGADFAAIDIIIDRKKRALVYSVKTNAGTIAIEEATGMYLTWYIARYVKKVFKQRRARYKQG